jgi:hypothetical protein
VRRRPAWARRRWLVVIALATPLLGLLGVIAAEVVPDGRIASHLVDAMYRGEITSEDRTVSLLGTTADHYAECVAVMNGLGDPPGNLVKRALYSATSYGCVGSIATSSSLHPPASCRRNRTTCATGTATPSSSARRWRSSG